MSIVLAIIALGVLIAVHELGHFLAALAMRMKVVRFSIGFGPPLLRWKRKGVEYVLSALPLGGYVHVFGMNPAEEGALEEEGSYQLKPRWARATVCVAGPLFSYALGILGYFSFFFVGQTQNEIVYRIKEIKPNSAAAAAGFVVGDDIGMIDELRPRTIADVGNYIDTHRGKQVVFRVDRQGSIIALTAQLPAEATEHGVLGIVYGEHINRVHTEVGFGQAFVASLKTTYANSTAILGALGKLFVSPTEVEVGGAPEIVNQIKKSVDRGLLDFIWLLAGLTVMFGLFNILPVPALDGSKLLFLGIEAIARRDLPANVQVAIHGVGFLLLMGLMVIVSIKDIVGWFTE